MASWRDFARRVEPTEDHRAISANSAKSAPVGAETAPIGTNGTNGTGLPAEIWAGLDRLRQAPVPRVRRPELWPSIVADAQRLAIEGWAGRALALGWHPLDVYGAVTDPDGDPDADGLAVKLNGRRLLAVCASFATVADENGGRTYLYRGNSVGARLLWETGGDGR